MLPGGGSLKSDVTFKGGGHQKVTLGDKGGVKNLKIKVTSFMDSPLHEIVSLLLFFVHTTCVTNVYL